MGLKEFVLGSPQEHAAKATIVTLSAKPNLNRREEDARPYEGLYEVFTRRPERGSYSGDITFNYHSFKNSESMNMDYLANLFSELQTEKATPESRSRAVLDNVGFTILNGDSQETVTMIDESGYFITAAHLLKPEINPSLPNVVFHPKSEMVSQVAGVLFDMPHDTAILYAPTGRRAKPVDNLMIRNSELQSGEPLWQIGIATDLIGKSRYTVEAIILNGYVDNPKLDINKYGWEDLIRVKGMKPFGGSSGGPIIDKTGAIVGVESGWYTLENISGMPQDRNLYTGSSIATMKYFVGLLNKKPVNFKTA